MHKFNIAFGKKTFDFYLSRILFFMYIIKTIKKENIEQNSNKSFTIFKKTIRIKCNTVFIIFSRYSGRQPYSYVTKLISKQNGVKTNFKL